MTVSANATFNASTFVVSGAGTFTLAAGSALGIGHASGIVSAGTNSGNIQTATRNFDVDAIYTFNGTGNQSMGTGFPNNLTGTLIINNPGNTVTLDNARTIAATGGIVLAAGTLAAGTNLTMASTSAITRSEGAMTGTPQGTGIYNVTYTGNSKTTGTELAGSGLMLLIANPHGGQTLTLIRYRAPIWTVHCNCWNISI